MRFGLFFFLIHSVNFFSFTQNKGVVLVVVDWIGYTT